MYLIRLICACILAAHLLSVANVRPARTEEPKPLTEAWFQRNLKSAETFKQIERLLEDDQVPEAVERLAKLLEDDFELNREKAIAQLTNLGPAAEPALPVLEKYLALDPSKSGSPIWSPEPLLTCASAIGRPALPLMLKYTKHNSERTRGLAIRAIGEARLQTPETLAAVHRLLVDDDAYVRHGAALAAGQLADLDSAPQMIELVEQEFGKATTVESVKDISFGAAQGLVAINHLPGLPAVERLYEEVVSFWLSKTPDAELENTGAYNARDELARMKQEAGYGWRAAVEGLSNSDFRVRLESIYILRRADKHAGQAVDAVLKVLDDENVILRFHAALALGHIEATQTVPLIERHLKEEPDWGVRYNLLWSLQHMNTKQSLEVYGAHCADYGLDGEEQNWHDYSGKYPGLFDGERPVATPWGSAPLANLGEPSLSQLKTGYAFRFTFADAGFSNTTVFRVYFKEDQARILRSGFGVHSADAGPYELGTGGVSFPVDRELTADEWTQFSELVSDYRVRSKPSAESGIFVLDGTEWIVEEFKKGKYHSFMRRSPEDRDHELVEIVKLLKKLAPDPSEDWADND